jgi:hypothetical protein
MLSEIFNEPLTLTVITLIMVGVVQLSFKPLSGNETTAQEQLAVKHNKTGTNIQKACLFLAVLGLFLSLMKHAL